MKVFQIFDRPTPPREPYLGYMRGVQAMADAYTLIAPANFMGGDWVPYADAWADLPVYLQENTNGARMGFDALRVRFLTRHFDMVYVDIDMEVLAPIPRALIPQAAGPGLLVGNGDPETGAACWAAYLRMCPNFCRPASLMFSGIPHHAIPARYFKHHFAKGQYF